jgi:hypothetical protein
MKDYRLNLAEQPFISPLISTVIPTALALVVLVFTAINIFALFSIQWGNEDNEAMIREARQQTELKVYEIDKIEEQLLSMDVKEYRSRATAANGIISRYTMSWTRLFNRMEEIVPKDLRMLRISPELKDQVMELRLRVAVKNQKVVRDFIGNMDNSPHFSDVILLSEVPYEDGMIFELTVQYAYQPQEGE